MTLYNPNNLIGNPKLDAKIAETENAGSITNDNYLYAASASEMTGLTPSIAHNEYEAQNYDDIFSYLPPASHPADGIRAEYRTEVTSQSDHERKNPHNYLQ